MKKNFILIIGLTLILSFQATAQTTNSVVPPTTFQPTPHIYYIYLSGVVVRKDIVAVEDKVRAKAGVTYCLGNRIPVRYFLLKSMNLVTQDDFAKWIDSKYKVEFFGEGEEAREGAILTFNRFHKNDVIKNYDLQTN